MAEKKIKSLADLTADPQNCRKHNPRNIGAIVNSLHKVGAARSIVIDENGVILAGNGLVEAAGEAGIENVKVVEADGNTVIAVRRTGLTPKQKAELAIADNRTAELADWDPKALLETVKDMEIDPRDVEFSADEWEKLSVALETEAAASTDPPAESGGGGVGLGTPVVQYAIIFDNEDQQRRWFNFLRYLKQRYPEPETLAARLDLYLETVDLT